MALKALAQRRIVDGQFADGQFADGQPLAGSLLAGARTGRLVAVPAARHAGQGIIWSLLAVGLAACGGGTNTIRVAGGSGLTIDARGP